MFNKINIRTDMSDMLKLDFGSNDFQSIGLGGNDGPSRVKVINDTHGNNNSPPMFQSKPNPPNLDMITNKDSGLGLDLLMNDSRKRKSPNPSSGMSGGMSPPSVNLGSSSPAPSMNEPFGGGGSGMFSQSNNKVDFSNDMSNSRSNDGPKINFTPGKLDLENDLDLDLGDEGMKPFSMGSSQYDNNHNSSSFGSSFDSQPTTTTFTSDSEPVKEEPKLTFEQIQKKKSEMLRKLERFRKKGYFVYRNLDMHSDFEDIKNEFENVKEEASLQRSLRQQKDILITASRVIEGAAGTELVQEYTGKLELEGWSQHMMETIDDYEDIMEDLHEEYGKMFAEGNYPVARLLFAVIHSAIMFHITKKYVQQMPNLGNLLNNNPHLAREFSRATANMVGEQNPAFAGMVNEMNGQQSETMEPRDMQGPSNLDDILQRLNTNNGMGNMNNGMGINMDI